MSPPTRLTRADVRQIAALARLELDETEIDLFARQLTGILEYAHSLQAVDTAGVPPYAGGLAEDRWREDTAVPSLSRADALSNAPSADTETGTFTVPKVIG
jgi:aspartyl-tRNA(Asn)/glutamyl-tRNA(Gln) amidotransferase subunit C